MSVAEWVTVSVLWAVVFVVGGWLFWSRPGGRHRIENGGRSVGVVRLNAAISDAQIKAGNRSQDMKDFWARQFEVLTAPAVVSTDVARCASDDWYADSDDVRIELLAAEMYSHSGSQVCWVDTSPALRSLYIERATPLIEAGWRKEDTA